MEYAAIYIRFLDFLHTQVGHAPTVADLSERALLAYRDYRGRSGGRGGAGVAVATVRKELAALRVLTRKARRPDLALALESPTHRPPPAETITDEEYERALRMPDRRTHTGRRDYAILTVLGETGLRNAELRGLRGRDLVRSRRDSPTRSLRVHGKGGRGRVLRLPRTADQALEEWLRVHPLARRVGDAWILPDDAPLFATLGRHGRDRGRALSSGALEDLVGKHLRAAGVAEHLAHPHVLRAYHLTLLDRRGVRLGAIQERSGHADIRTLVAHYLTLTAADRDGLLEVLDDIDDRR